MTIVAGIGDEVLYSVLFVTLSAVVYFVWKSTAVRDLPSRARLVVTALRTVDGRPQPVFQISRTINIDLPPGLLSGESQINEITEAVTAELSDQGSAGSQENSSESVEENLETNVAPTESETMSEATSTEGTSTEVPDGSEISVRLIFLDDSQRVVKARKLVKVGEFKRLHFREASDHTKVVRLIFNGQVLSNDSLTLEDYGVFDNCAVHCLIHPNRNQHQPQGRNENSSLPTSPQVDPQALGDFPRGFRHFGGFQRGGAIVAEFEIDFGALMVPLFAIILGLCWYCRFTYDELFSAEATVSLVGLTTLFTGFMFVMYIPIRGLE